MQRQSKLGINSVRWDNQIIIVITQQSIVSVSLSGLMKRILFSLLWQVFRDVVLSDAVKSFQTHPCPKACWRSSKQALALGYSTPSNFIAMFRKIYGESPARYFFQMPCRIMC